MRFLPQYNLTFWHRMPDLASFMSKLRWWETHRSEQRLPIEANRWRHSQYWTEHSNKFTNTNTSPFTRVSPGIRQPVKTWYSPTRKVNVDVIPTRWIPTLTRPYFKKLWLPLTLSPITGSPRFTTRVVFLNLYCKTDKWVKVTNHRYKTCLRQAFLSLI